jgi:hypothetical protein
MQLERRAQYADAELWRAVHDAPMSTLPRSEELAGERVDEPHGMPADRLAMAASRSALNRRGSEQLR